MRIRSIKQAITSLMLLFFMTNAGHVFAQSAVAVPQSVGQVVVAESAIQKEVPMEDAITTSELPVYVPDFIVEVKEKPQLTKKARAKQFVTLKWIGFLKWFWTPPKINQNSKSAKLLQDWEEMIGFNAFYAYFKAQEARKIIKEKCTFRVLGMRATADYTGGKVWLIFKRKF